MRALIYLALANVGRRLTAWAESHLEYWEGRPRPIADVVRETWQ